VIDLVETRLDVGVQHPLVALATKQVDLSNRVLRPPPGPESIRDRLEVGLEDRFQHQLQRCLHDPVRHRRYPEATNLSRSARFGDGALPHRKRPERSRLQLGTQIVQEARNAHTFLDIGDREAIDAGGTGTPVTRDPVERHDQRRRVVHEIEQIIEPATMVGRRPTVKLGLHLRYPGERIPFLARTAGIPRWIFRHCSFLPFCNRCRPSPCDRLSRPRSTTTAPPHPSPIGRRWTQPDPRTGSACSGQNRGGSRVHCCSLVGGGALLCPSGIATATPQHFTMASRQSNVEPPRSSPTVRDRGRAPRPAHIRQVRAGHILRDVNTQVPLVLLSVPLAGPAPSGSSGTSRLCQGCSHLPRHLPDQAALSSTALLRQGQR
jgi:hypothetical protein